MAIDSRNLATVQEMWRREVEAAATYRHLANRERDLRRKDILVRLAEQEDKHAARWSERIAAATGHVPCSPNSAAPLTVVPCARITFSPRMMSPLVASSVTLSCTSDSAPISILRSARDRWNRSASTSRLFRTRTARGQIRRRRKKSAPTTRVPPPYS